MHNGADKPSTLLFTRVHQEAKGLEKERTVQREMPQHTAGEGSWERRGERERGNKPQKEKCHSIQQAWGAGKEEVREEGETNPRKRNAIAYSRRGELRKKR